MRLILLLTLTSFLVSCGTTNHYAPMRPMTEAKAQGMFSVSYSLSDFQSVALQLGFFFKLTEDDMIGISSQSFLIPNSVSYVRLWETSASAGNYQLHINNLVTANHSPTYEARVAVFDDKQDPSQSFEAGVGIYATPLLYAISGRKFPVSFAPLLAYQYRGDRYAFQAQYIHQYSAYKTREILSYSDPDFDYVKNEWSVEGPDLVYRNDKIRRFERSDNDASWVIETTTGDTLTLTKRDPYPDCFACAINAGKLRSTLPDESHEVYWIYDGMNSQYVVLNVTKAYSDYQKGLMVDLRPEKDYLKKSLRKNRFLIDDLSISAGIRIRD